MRTAGIIPTQAKVVEMIHHLRTAAVISVALTSLLTACGSSSSASDSDGAKAFTYSGSDRDTYLAACAKKEGSLTWYTSLAGDVIDDMITAFNDKYPDINVDTFRSDENAIAARVSQESQADRLKADVLEMTSDSFRALGETGVLAEWTSPAQSKFSARFTYKDSKGGILGVGDRASYVGFGYNTSKVATAPTSLQDLLAPDLKGKLAITNSTTGVRFVGNVLEQLGDDAGKAFLAKLKAQDVKVESVSGAALAGLVAQGQDAASPGVFRNHVAQLTSAGDPIKWSPLGEATANVGYAGVFTKAAHPCAAMLFLDTLLGDAGTKVYDGLEYPRPDEDLGFKFWVPDESYKTSEDYQAAYKTWQDIFNETFNQ